MAYLGENLNNTLGTKLAGLNTELESFVPTIKSLQVNLNKPNFLQKANKFLTNTNGAAGTVGGYGSLIGAGLDMVGGLIKPPPGYSGKKGNIQQGLDKTWDAASNAVTMIPGVGTAIGVGMKALGVLNKGIQRLGGGTDGMTTADSILNSNLFGWNIGLINGIGGKKANTYTRNEDLDTKSASGFGGFQLLQSKTQEGAGKKYGLFSSGARDKQNKLTEYTQGVKHTISGIVDFNTLNNMAALGSTQYVMQQQNTDLNGGIHMLRAAKGGLKFPKPFKYEKPYKFKPPKYDPEGMTVDKDKWEETYVNGKRYFIKANQTYYRGDPIPTKDGDLLYKKLDGKIIKYPYHKSLFAKNGGQFIQNVLRKYQSGDSLKRTVQVFDVGSGKYVQIQIPLSKDQIAGRMPIRLANGTAVFMNGDGTVTSDRWETIGRREHLTPKGQDGIKVEEQLPFGITYNKENNIYLTNIDKKSSKQEKKELNKYVKENPKFKGWRVWEHESGRYFILPRDLADKLDWQYVDNIRSGGSSGGNILGRRFINSEGTVLYEVLNPKFDDNGNPVTHVDDKGNGYNSPDDLQPAYKKGGKMNVIPEGALHARKNHLTDIDDMYKAVTHKGIPVITIEDNGEIIQHAEVEHSEIIFTKEVTDKIEKYREQGTDEAAIACGKLLVQEILYNTDDRIGLIKTV